MVRRLIAGGMSADKAIELVVTTYRVNRRELMEILSEEKFI